MVSQSHIAVINHLCKFYSNACMIMLLKKNLHKAYGIYIMYIMQKFRKILERRNFDFLNVISKKMSD